MLNMIRTNVVGASHWRAMAVSLCCLVCAQSTPLYAQVEAQEQDVPRLEWHERAPGQPDDGMERGQLVVWENRVAQEGRTLSLDVVVLRARSETPRPDPMFFFMGGPGLAAATTWSSFANHWIRAERDIVLMSQRGTGGSNRLDCSAPGAADDLQGYFDQVFENVEAFEECLAELRTHADLAWYGTATAMDDFDDLRRLMHYNSINVSGGSYGSRAVMEYVHRHGEHVRTAIVNGVAPIMFVNPLFHASSAQSALEIICEECANDPDCNAAYPDLEKKVTEVLHRLRAEPAPMTLARVNDQGPPMMLTRDAFAEGLRILMYYDSRRIPFLIQQAFDGNYEDFARAGFNTARAIRDALAFGMLLCVTCSEDVNRIDPATIAAHCDGTFLGDARVRSQMAVCALWPDSVVPADHGAPLVSDVPILMLSGKYDPVTPPKFASMAAQHLPNALHVIAPGSHGVGGPCIDTLIRALLENGSTEGIDASCVESMEAGPFFVPDRH